MRQWPFLVLIVIALALWAVFAYRPSVQLGLGNAAAVTRPCRPTAAEIAATEIAVTAYPALTPTPTALTQPLVTTELVALAGDQDVPLLQPSLVFRIPLADLAETNTLHVSSLEDVVPAEGAAAPGLLDARNSYKDALKKLLTNNTADPIDLGLFTDSTSGNAVELLQDALDIDNPPIVGVEGNRTVALVIPQRDRVLADNRDEFAGGWTVTSSGRNITLRFTGEPDAKTAWDIRVCTDGLPIISANLTTPTPETPAERATPTPIPTPTPSPTPTPVPAQAAAVANAIQGTPTPAPTPATAPTLVSQNASNVHWSFPATNLTNAKGVEVVVQTSPIGAFRMWLFSGPRKLFATFLAYIIPAILLGAGLWFATRWKTPSAETTESRAKLLAITKATVRLTIAAVLSLFVDYIYRETSIPASWNAFASGTLANALPDGWKWIGAGLASVGFPLILLLFVGIAVVGLGFLFPQRPGEATQDLEGALGGKTHDWAGELLLGAIAIAAFVASLIYMTSGSTYNTNKLLLDINKYDLISSVLLTVGYTMFLATAIHTWRQRAAGPVGSWKLMALPTIGLVTLLLCILRLEIDGASWWNHSLVSGLLPFWITCCFVVGVVLFAGVLIRAEIDASRTPGKLDDVRCQIKRLREERPASREGQEPVEASRSQQIDMQLADLARQATALEADPSAANDRSSTRARGTGTLAQWVYAAMLIVAILAQWAWAYFEQQSIWWRAPVEADPVRYLPEVSKDRLTYGLQYFPPTFFVAVLDLLLLLGLVSFVGVLRTAGQCSRTPFWEAHQQWVKPVVAGLFLAVVIGYGGQVLGFRVPVALAAGLVFFLFPLVWSDSIERASHRVDQANNGAEDGQPRIAASRKTLIWQALNRDKAQAGPPAGDFPPKLTLKGKESYSTLALALGPEEGWWKNGALAVQLGGILAILPVAYFVFVFLTSRGGEGWSLGAPFAVTGLISTFANEVAFWLVAAFTLGCLYPSLRGANGLLKGAALAAVYIGGNAFAALMGIPGNALWQVRAFQLLLFLMLLGAWLDIKTLEREGYSWRDVITLYELPEAAPLIKQGLPLLIALAGVLVQLYSQETQQATENLVSGKASEAILEFLCQLTPC